MKRIKLIGLLLLVKSFALAQTVEDQQDVIQLSIDLPSLNSYYVNEKPLIIADEGVIPSHLTLTKFGEPVDFISIQDLFFIGEQAFLDFDEFEISPTQAKVVFRYPIKKLTIRLIIEKRDGEWSLIEKTLTVD